MIYEHKKALTNKLAGVNGLNVKNYRGEFSSEKGESLKSSDFPLALVDFVDARTEHLYQAKIGFLVYLAHLTPSSAAGKKEKKEEEISDLIEKIHRTLGNALLTNKSEPIKIERIQKRYDATTPKGYLQLFTISVSVSVQIADFTLADQNFYEE